MTDDAWFGVTPEPVARFVTIKFGRSTLTNFSKIAQHLADGTPPEKVILIDVFAGAGGNTIAFAQSGRWKRVYAIERDPLVLACAKHNAEIYGVSNQISWYEGDCFEIIQKELAEMGEYAVIWRRVTLSNNMQAPDIVPTMFLTCPACNPITSLLSLNPSKNSRRTWRFIFHEHQTYGN